jgi:hypothetical protein
MSSTGRNERTHRVTTDTTTDHQIRSIAMYTMHEALARDRMRDQQQRSHDAQLARELSAQRRWHRVSLRARAAHARHTRRVEQLQAR